MKMKAAFLAFMIVLLISPAFALMKSFQPDSVNGTDANIENGTSGDTNYGSYAFPSVGIETTGKRWLFSWNFTSKSFPQEVNVVSCKLNLYVHSNNGVTNNKTYGIFRVNRSWSESTVTWNNFGSVAGGKNITDFDSQSNIVI